MTPLKAWRSRAKMTQQLLAEKSGLNIRQIQKIEAGEILPQNMAAGNLIALADSLCCKPEALLRPAWDDNLPVRDMFEAMYGGYLPMCLSSLGGNTQEIFAGMQNIANGNNVDEIALLLGIAPAEQVPVLEAVDATKNAILHEIKFRFFSEIPREKALTICDAIGEFGTFSIGDDFDLSFNDRAFANEWNKANPDQPPIQKSPEGIC